jgi:hypothetical protein
MAIELTGDNLKLKYRVPKPHGKGMGTRNGNSGKGRGKHIDHPKIHGIMRKKYVWRV